MTYDRAKLIRDLTREEGSRLKWYRCTAGKRSIGVGRNLDDVGISALETRVLGITVASCIANGITPAERDYLLANDIARTEAALDAKLPWWRSLCDVRQRVLLDMCFNMGIGRAPDPAHGIKGTGLLGFTSTLPRIQHGDYAGAVTGMQASAWHDQVGDRAVRLEAMMATGKDPA